MRGAERKKKNPACISPFPLEKKKQQDDNEAVATMRCSLNRTKKKEKENPKNKQRVRGEKKPKLSSPK